MMGGYTRVLPEEDRFFWTKKQFEDMLAYFMGGHVAEEIIFNEISTGASNDIERATGLARRMVTEYGMSKTLGPLAFGRKEELIFLGREINEQRNYSDEIAFQIDKEIRELIDEAYAMAKRVLIEQQDKLEAIAMLLMERETIEAWEMEELFDTPRPKPTLSGPQNYTPIGQPSERPDNRGQEAAPRFRPQPASG
jgi:cell division protease FtsH